MASTIDLIKGASLDERTGVSKLSHFTPLAVGAAWYASGGPLTEETVELLSGESTQNGEAEYLTPAGIARALFSATKRSQMRLYNAVASSRHDLFGLAAFRPVEEIDNHSNIGPKWSHAVLQWALADRLVWAMGNYGGQDPPAVSQLPSIPYPNPELEKKEYRKWARAENDWIGTVKKFVSNFKRKGTREIGAGPNGNSDIVDGLVLGEVYTYSQRAVLAAENHLCMAALGLRALLVDETQYSEATYAQRLVAANQLSRSEEMCGWSDYKMLRPLYTAVSFLSLSLLATMNLSPRSKSGLSLAKLTQHMVYPHPPAEKNRLRVEQDIWKVVVNMAINGRSVYQDHMSRTIDYWEANGILEPSSSPLPTVDEIKTAWSIGWDQFKAGGQRLVAFSIREMLDKIASPELPLLEPPSTHLHASHSDGQTHSLRSPPTSPRAPLSTSSPPPSCTSPATPPPSPTHPQSMSEACLAPSPPTLPPYDPLFLPSPKSSPPPPRTGSAPPLPPFHPSLSASSASPSSPSPSLLHPPLPPSQLLPPPEKPPARLATPPSPRAAPNRAKEGSAKGAKAGSKRKRGSERSAGRKNAKRVRSAGKPQPERRVSPAKPPPPQDAIWRLPVLQTKAKGRKTLAPMDYELLSVAAESVEGQIRWVDVSYKMRPWKGLDNDFERLTEIIGNTITGDLVASGGCEKFVAFTGGVKVLSKEHWDGLCREERRDLFRQHDIHVVGRGTQASLLPGVTSFDKKELGEWMDLRTPRFVHDLLHPKSGACSSERIQRDGLLPFLMRKKEADAAREKGEPVIPYVVNYLDIDMSKTRVSLPVRQLEDGAQYAHKLEQNHSWRTEWPTSPFCWALLSSAMSSSAPHIDASGFATYVAPILGAKVWWIALQYQHPTCNGWANCIKWQPVVLRPGDQLYMRPGALHYVMTTDDCLVVGGHFYTSTNFERTLTAIVHEHYYGAAVTNTEHAKAVIVLFKLISGYRDIAVYGDEEDADELPSNQQLAALLVLVVYFDQLHPDLPEDSRSSLWHDEDCFSEDHAYALQCAQEIYQSLNAGDFRREVKRQHEHFLETCRALEQLDSDDPSLVVRPTSFFDDCLCSDEESEGEGSGSDMDTSSG